MVSFIDREYVESFSRLPSVKQIKDLIISKEKFPPNEYDVQISIIPIFNKKCDFRIWGRVQILKSTFHLEPSQVISGSITIIY